MIQQLFISTFQNSMESFNITTLSKNQVLSVFVFVTLSKTILKTNLFKFTNYGNSTKPLKVKTEI